MAYICICKDHPGSSAARGASTAAHLAYIETILDHILVAGPIPDDASGEYIASCFVYDTDQESEAMSLLHNDPYYKAGIYAEIQFHPFRPAAGTWIGGKTW